MTILGANQPHALYRFYDAAGSLLYIGLTVDPGTRWKTHRREKPWWLDVANISIEHFPDRASVERAERVAIQTERPRYNSTHNTNRQLASTRWRWDLPVELVHRLTPNQMLSTLIVHPELPPFGQWLDHIYEEGYGYGNLTAALTRANGFKPSMNPGQVELVLHMSGALDKNREDFTEAREAYNYRCSIAGVEVRTDVYDLRADQEQIWAPRRIWIWHGSATVVQLDRNAYVETVGPIAALTSEFRIVAGAFLRDGLDRTTDKNRHPAAPEAAIDDRAVTLAVPSPYLDDTLTALLAAELRRDVDPLRRLAGALAFGPVR